MTAGPDEHLLEPALPYDMKPRVARAVADVRLQQFVNSAAAGKDELRRAVFDEVFGPRYDDVRVHAAAIKQHVLDHLDAYLARFAERATEAGATIHVAEDAEAANAICVEIARRRGATRCVKSKSMVTEETRLLPALEAAGIETVETDLGEFIVQLDGDAPSHIVTPIIHKDRTTVAQSFERELGAAYTEDPEALTRIAREHLRAKYRAADIGVTGANFLVAETGSLVICTNEGNADFTAHGPPVHVAMVGIEKLVPRLDDLAVFLKLLARSSTGQPITVYTTIVTGPRRPVDPNGPDELHVVLVDNGRTGVLNGRTRELLRCIRCGACLNTCPVFRKVGGGHAYGAVYSGPIGAALTPRLAGIGNYPDLPRASSLCGACRSVCPVDIDLPSQLVDLRRELVAARVGPRRVRLGYRAWGAILSRPRLYRLGMRAARIALRALGRGDSERRWIERGPGPLAGWTAERDLPAPAPHSFRDWWRAERERGR
jgi:L-lactate dehydrogenase complex protein LldF